MRQRVVSLLLLPCVVLTQSGAAFGHAHQGGEPAGHGLRPHFHFSFDAGTHACGHAYHHSADQHGEHHHHAATDAELPVQPKPCSDHDSDAVYVNNVDLLVRPHSTFAEQATVWTAWSTPEAPATVGDFRSPGQKTIAAVRHPPPGGYDCPLYLLQLALLI